MSPLIPGRPDGSIEPAHPRLHQTPPSRAEQRARREVRAAQWRARELVETIFGEVTEMGLTGIRASGPFRGLLRMAVPFTNLELHHDREALFLAAVSADPVLSQVPLLYVIGPAS